jgi:peptidoglycan/xylan/chitin deacetylase (PgdA/CDA1 family)
MRASFLVGAAAAAWTLPAAAPIARPVASGLRLPRTIDADDGVALTFDDGPHPAGTPAVLEALAREGAKATFFLVGEQVERSPSLAAEIVAAGHAIALHGHRHRCLLRVPPRALAADFERVATIVADATGLAPRVYRPPYGIFSPAGIALVRRRDWRPLLWSRWGRDWAARATPEKIARKTTEHGLSAGDVLLLHDADTYSAPGSWRRTAEAVPRILDVARAAGLRDVIL